jgi:hypothetical protein
MAPAANINGAATLKLIFIELTRRVGLFQQLVAVVEQCAFGHDGGLYRELGCHSCEFQPLTLLFIGGRTVSSVIFVLQIRDLVAPVFFA